MKCPICNSIKHVEVDLHADGFSQDILECGDCGGLWTSSGLNLRTLKKTEFEDVKNLSMVSLA